MTNLKKQIKLTFLLLAFLSLNFSAFAQCGTFAESTQEEEGLAAHSLYRDAVKAEKYDEAFENWKKAYEIAPAANGKNHLHFADGRKIYKHFLANETDAAKKGEHIKMILSLYDGQSQCYGKKGQDAFLAGRKGYDMFYYYTDHLGDNPYQSVVDVLATCIEKGGNSVEDIILVPYAGSVVNLFAKEKISKEKARGIYEQLNGIADYNIANTPATAERFKAAKESMNQTFAQIENHIFDCAYFKTKMKPEYDANPNDPKTIENVIRVLKRQGCDASDPFMQELEGKWATYASAENAKRQATFNANNPNVMAKKKYDAGDYAGAIADFEKAISQASDQSKKAGYYFKIASIQGRKMKQYSKARTSAKKAASLRPGWGDPYMLIADLYATTASKCGDDWNQRLAVLAAIEMYSKAKSVDPSVASDASSKITRYLGSRPDQQEAFMRGVKEGQKASVGCWIGGKVTVKFK